MHVRRCRRKADEPSSMPPSSSSSPSLPSSSLLISSSSAPSSSSSSTSSSSTSGSAPSSMSGVTGSWERGVALLDASYGTVFRDLLNLKCEKEELEGGVGVILRIIELLDFWETRLGGRRVDVDAWRLRLQVGLITQRDSDATCRRRGLGNVFSTRTSPVLHDAYSISTHHTINSPSLVTLVTFTCRCQRIWTFNSILVPTSSESSEQTQQTLLEVMGNFLLSHKFVFCLFGDSSESCISTRLGKMQNPERSRGSSIPSYSRDLPLQVPTANGDSRLTSPTVTDPAL
jgi:hypothetical protein